MKTLFFGIVAGAILCAVSLAQEASPSQTDPAPQDQQNPPTTQSEQPSAEQASLRLTPGSIIPVQLTKTIDAKKAKAGDQVEANVTQDLTTQNGAVVVPKDTKVLGHVTEAQARTKEQPESRVGIAFDHAVVKGKGDVPLPMSIQAIIAPPTANPNYAGGGNAGEPAPAPGPGMGQGSPGGMSGNSGSRSSGTQSGTQQPMPTPSPSAGESPSGAQSARQPITGNTQGVVGISKLKLETGANPTQGSLVSSEKNNVKLESGTLMLLRVTQ
jgi:hypothetical protein